MKRTMPSRALVVTTVVLGLFALTTSAAGQEISFSVKTTTGAMYGTAYEYVYNTAWGTTYTLSELDWALQPLFYAQAALEMKAFGGLLASLNVRLGLPIQTGYMTDSDWLNYDVNKDPRKTNFSQSNCFTERAILLDLHTGWEFMLTKGFTIEPFTAFAFMDFKWTGRDGYLQYPPESQAPYTPWSPSESKIPIYGTAIIYEQNYLIPAVGLKAAYRFSDRIDAELSFSFSPLAYCFDRDDHLLAWAYYIDNMGPGWYFEPELMTVYRMSERWTVSIDASYRYITGLIGDIKQYSFSTGTPATYSNSAGVAYNALSVSVSFTMVL